MALRYLLDMDLGGRVLRYATTPTAVTSSVTGDTYPYMGGLVSRPVSVMSPSLPLTLPPPPGETWIELIESSEGIDGAPLVVRIHEDGETLEQAVVLMRGAATKLQVGAGPMPLRLSLEPVPRGQDGVAPPVGHVVQDNVNWPQGVSNTINSADDGVPYPVVFGCPGAHSNGDIYHAYRVPCVLIDTSSGADYWVVGDGPIAASAADIEVVKVDTGASSHVTTAMSISTVQTRVDLLGVPVAIGSSAPGDTDPTDGAEYYCGHSTSGGGFLLPDGSAAARTAVDVIVGLLRRYTSIPLDLGRLYAARERLRGYLIDGALEEPELVWEYIQAEILPLLPVAVRWSEEGMYLVVLEYAPDDSHVTASYGGAGETLQRTSDATMRYDLHNRQTIAFAMTRHGPRDRATLTGDRDAGQTQWFGGINSSFVSSLRCRQSEARYGIREAETIETPCVWDRATAKRILRWRAARHALPIWAVEYVGGPDLRRHEIGDVIKITDADMGWTARYALIEDMTVSPGEVALSLSVLPDV